MDQVALKELMSYPVVEFAKGEQVLSLDSDASYVYYLVEGNCMRQITTSTGEDLFFEEYMPGESVYALVGPYLKYTTATADIGIGEMVALAPIRAHRLTSEELCRQAKTPSRTSCGELYPRTFRRNRRQIALLSLL